MIIVVTSITHDYELFYHFKAYYESLGVDEFVIGITDRNIPGLMRRFKIDFPQSNIRVVNLSERFETTGVEADNKDELRLAYLNPNDWMIPADLDEFVEFPTDLQTIITEMEQIDGKYCVGWFNDRITASGELTTIDVTRNLFEQYPLDAPISQQLVQACSHKIVLCPASAKLSSGHHCCDIPYPAYSDRCFVHHFKWTARLVKALKDRIACYKKQNIPWIPESERTLDYIYKNGRLIPEDFGAKQGKVLYYPLIAKQKKLF